MNKIIEKILHNFWLKFIALVLAALTWLYVAGQLTKR